MRSSCARPLAWIVLVLLPAGCGSGSSLEGEWTLDAQAIEEFDTYRELTDDRKKMLRGMLKMLELEMSITADTMKFSGQLNGRQESEELRYKIQKRADGKLLLETTNTQGEQETVTAEVKGDLLLLSRGKWEMFPLRRK